MFSKFPMSGTAGTGLLSGAHVKYLMRVNKITILELAVRMGISVQRVRHVRKNGTPSLATTQDWVESILGR